MGLCGKKGLHDWYIFHIQKKLLRISKDQRNFGHGRLKIFHIYNLGIISLKKRDSGPVGT